VVFFPMLFLRPAMLLGTAGGRLKYLSDSGM
jgi:hypothetical protein